MAFHVDLPGWLYIIQNNKLGYLKLGITNNLDDRIPRFGSDWIVVFAVYDNGHMIKLLETVTREFIIARSKDAKSLLRHQLKTTGHTETFPIKKNASIKSIYRFVMRARNQIRSFKGE